MSFAGNMTRSGMLKKLVTITCEIETETGKLPLEDREFLVRTLESGIR
jgi:hypothetical protein